MPRPAPTFPYIAYRAATAILAGRATRVATRKLRRAGVAPARIRERSGIASLPRPEGRLVWLHGASVGELLSALTLASRLGSRLPDASFLLTSGTASSAEIVSRRLPPRSRHQFSPVDTPFATRRFLGHWRPNAGVFVESELWPNLLVEARRGGAPLALLNARLSESSARAWARFPATARFVLGQFSACVAQNAAVAETLRSLGADPSRVSVGGNIKAMSDPLPVDGDLLDRMRGLFGERQCWVAASTHPGEEEEVLAAHELLLARMPNSAPAPVLVLVPRHPERGAEIAETIAKRGLRQVRRSQGEEPGPKTQVYLADTLGEIGTWYALAPIAFLGGSLKPVGGHNPIEPAQAGCAVLSGPETFNFDETFESMSRDGAVTTVSGAESLAAAVRSLFDDPDTLRRAADAANAFTRARKSDFDALVETLVESLGLEGRTRPEGASGSASVPAASLARATEHAMPEANSTRAAPASSDAKKEIATARAPADAGARQGQSL